MPIAVALCYTIVMDYLTHDRKIIAPQELDFIIPSQNLAIEINDIGTHFFPAKPKDYHQHKFLKAQQQGYHLWTIWQWQLAEREDLLRSMLESKMKRSPERIYARQCVVISVTPPVARAFYNQCHIQGWCPATTHCGLLYNDNLVAIMSWSIKKEEAELCRYATSLHTQVVGGFSRLFQHSAPHTKRLYTYSFNDYSTGAVYAQNGWKKVSDVSPRYWWVKKNGHQVLNRRSCQKQKIIKRFNLSEGYWDKTEFEIMTMLGYVQIFDCGKQRWEYEA